MSDYAIHTHPYHCFQCIKERGRKSGKQSTIKNRRKHDLEVIENELDAMCDCPKCRGGYEDECLASIQIDPIPGDYEWRENR